jgi:pectate lyase
MIIIDNFVRDLTLIEKLQSPSLWNTYTKYLWEDKNFSADSCVFKQLIKYIWVDNCPLNTSLEHIEGFEYWTGVYEENDRKERKDREDDTFYHLFKHQDKDEKEWEQTGKVISPIIGTVFYPHQDNDYVKGGDLKIWETKDVPISNISFELIRPKFNRLVIFDPSYLHAVTMVTQGFRRAIAINLWEDKPSTFFS